MLPLSLLYECVRGHYGDVIPPFDMKGSREREGREKREEKVEKKGEELIKRSGERVAAV